MYKQGGKSTYKIMKNIKLFKYKDTSEFIAFVDSYDYKLDDVVGFSFDEQKQLCGNVLKWYKIYFNDGEYEYFKVVIFESFHEYKQALLGFSCNKLISWFEDSDLREYK